MKFSKVKLKNGDYSIRYYKEGQKKELIRLSRRIKKGLIAGEIKIKYRNDKKWEKIDAKNQKKISCNISYASFNAELETVIAKWFMPYNIIYRPCMNGIDPKDAEAIAEYVETELQALNTLTDEQRAFLNWLDLMPNNNGITGEILSEYDKTQSSIKREVKRIKEDLPKLRPNESTVSFN